MNTKTDAGKIKLSFDEPQFYVNEKKRTVACKIFAYCRVPGEVYRYLNADLGGFETVGVSTCQEGDKWNETLGRHLAESKAKKLAFQKARRDMAGFLKDLTPVIRSLIKFEESMDRLSNYEIEHLGDLSDLSEEE